MEVSHNNPNEALTPIFVEDNLVYIPVAEYYTLNEQPELILARLATRQALREDEQDGQERTESQPRRI